MKIYDTVSYCYQSCQNCNLDVSSFNVNRNGDNEYKTKTQKVTVIKKSNTMIEFTFSF